MKGKFFIGGSMLTFLIHHKQKILFLILVMLSVMVVNIVLGELKKFSEIDWIDVVGEGGSAVAMALWIIFIWGSRPLGRVTNLLSLGLGFMFLAFFQDALDEFIRISTVYWWDQGFESMAMPVGIIILTYGLYHWNQEQILINKQLRKREQFFREHRNFDSVTNLGRIDFLKGQLSRFFKNANSLPVSLLLIDIENFDDFNRRLGVLDGDLFLHGLSELLILNLRNQDLVCRYAGDCFAVVLPDTDNVKAKEISNELENAVKSYAFKTSVSSHSEFQAIAIGIGTMEGDGNCESLIAQAGQSLMGKKSFKRVA